MFNDVILSQRMAKMWFRNDKPSLLHVSKGASFSRPQTFDMMETAKIIAIGTDHLGIPHVRYNVKLSGHLRCAEEQRTLSLESFRSLYPQPVAIGL